ncbi:alpha/beta fold hydrolase [Terricaulis sp.]|uniref:alpha/beta fold hydrolase n=1 Tax=Terricaulis sp. TaxID=2768686 RepID=UPI003783707A
MDSQVLNFRRVAYEVPGGRVAGIAFGAETANPDIVFVHATGFNARTYRTLLAPLGDRYHVLAIDVRGHGQTQLPPKLWGYTSWRRHRDDLIALLEKNFTAPVTLAGHSMGATVSLLTAGRRRDLVNGLALIEPVILPPGGYAFVQLPFGPAMMRASMPLARGAAARRNHFESKEQAVTAFTGRGIFKVFPPEVIADYVEDGLIEDAKHGGFKLACAPQFEAATFCAQRNDPWGALAQVSAPLVLLRAEQGSTTSPASMHRIQAMKPDARVGTVEGAGHMLPIERPDRVRTAIESALLMAHGGKRFRDIE